jgi:two-component system, OmpR family, sensor histidine kinase KdpD
MDTPLNLQRAQPRPPLPATHFWPATLAWALGWAAMLALDGAVDLANLAMILVLSSAVASLWLPAWASATAGLVAVLAFNWVFVPPRGTFSVDLHQHALLLGAMVLVNAILATLTGALRGQAQRANRQAFWAERTRSWSDTLRDAAEPQPHVGQLQEALAQASGLPVALLVLKSRLPAGNDSEQAVFVGEPDDDQRAGLWACLRQGKAMGPGTTRHHELADLYVPLRGRGSSWGAAVFGGVSHAPQANDWQVHAQVLCDQMGQALQRGVTAKDEQQARELAQTQSVRNALLAAISHDYRTPLATIMGAASSLDEQAERLNAEQRRRLARSIVEEVAQLSRMTDNTLQLARLDAPQMALRCDWESAEELLGSALANARKRDPQRRVRGRLEPGLPLLWCDAMLMSQLLDNLVDNALKYSAPDSPIEILMRRQGAQVILAVRDRGAGIAPAWRERSFEVFRRGADPVDTNGQSAQAARPGAGVGLAVCRAIARAHGGELKLRARGHGGCSFECSLPVKEPPPEPPELPEATETPEAPGNLDPRLPP